MADSETPRNGQTYVQRLKQGEEHVFWKLSFRIAICVLNIIGIGAAGWTLANALKFHANPYIGYFSGPTVAPYILIVCSISFIFCLICILVLLLRRPPRPAHPGIAVGCDLILWLAFIVTALFSVAGLYSLAYFGNDSDYLEDPSYSSGDYSGSYYRAPNNTWIYNITSVSPYSSTSTSGTGYGDYYYNYTRHDWQLNNTRPSVSSVTRDCSDSGFDSCAEQDAYVNDLWHSRNRRFATQVVTAAVQWLNVLLHFILFVWACVDTHRRNRNVKQGRMNDVADRVITDLQSRGLITVNAAAEARAGRPEGQPLMSETRSARGVRSTSVGPSEQR